jgi:hypothetical protein
VNGRPTPTPPLDLFTPPLLVDVIAMLSLPDTFFSSLYPLAFDMLVTHVSVLNVVARFGMFNLAERIAPVEYREI